MEHPAHAYIPHFRAHFGFQEGPGIAYCSIDCDGDANQRLLGSELPAHAHSHAHAHIQSIFMSTCPTPNWFTGYVCT